MPHRFRTPTPKHAARCFEIESAAYDASSAAPQASIARRIAQYPEGFLLVELDDTIVGFINSGCAHQVEMADHDFKDMIGHDPKAPHIVIMSVVVDPEFQGQGLAKALMQEFIKRAADMKKQTVQLMCREHLIPFYGSFGFRYIRPSDSDHGGGQWHEMTLDL
ncbi:MAG: GNAT family N-acetyltransferase [Marinosulfonomonas sp.]